MTDSGEGLVDANARLQERIDEREEEKKRRAAQAQAKDPDQRREIESLRLARTELERQSAATKSDVRRKQIALAIAELDRRIGGVK